MQRKNANEFDDRRIRTGGAEPVQWRRTVDLPDAREAIPEIASWREGRQTPLFLDYDGTLTPLVERPEQADLSGRMRRILERLAERVAIAVVSGRGLSDVRRKVGLDRLFYAGSHGFEIDGPGDPHLPFEIGRDALPALDEAERRLRRHLAGIRAAVMERKRFSLAVHYRRANARESAIIENRVDEALRRCSGLRKGRGKKVFELQPDLDWDKGRAVLWLMARWGLSTDNSRPVYIGDDVTDEDAFRVLQGYGAGIVVHGGEDRRTCAGYGLAGPNDVLEFLRCLAAAVERSDTPAQG
jgi:trehalose-phosphatase